MKKNELRAQVATAVRACQDKKATDISILQLDTQASGFTDYFVICSGSNPRQIVAIADDVDERLSAHGLEPTHREGYKSAEWVLLDYVDFVVHIFSESARKFYDLERLWKTATRVELSDLEKPARKAAPAKTTAARKSATKSPVRSAAKKSVNKKSSASRKAE
jgi:ribosome-associated protein